MSTDHPPAYCKQTAPKGMQRLLRATGHSFRGLLRVWQDEQAFRQEIWLGAVFIAPIALLPVSLYEAVALLAAWLLVLIVESLNSAVEAAVDRVGYELHDLSRKAKDIGSLAVLLTLLLAALVWLAVTLSHLELSSGWR